MEDYSAEEKSAACAQLGGLPILPTGSTTWHFQLSRYKVIDSLLLKLGDLLL